MMNLWAIFASRQTKLGGTSIAIMWLFSRTCFLIILLTVALGGCRQSRDKILEEGPTTILRGHWGGVVDLRFSPNGRVLASTGQDGILRLWDVATWKEGWSYGWGLSGITFSRTGNYFANITPKQGQGTLWVLQRFDVREKGSTNREASILHHLQWGIPSSPGSVLVPRPITADEYGGLDWLLFAQSGGMILTAREDTVSVWRMAESPSETLDQDALLGRFPEAEYLGSTLDPKGHRLAVQYSNRVVVRSLPDGRNLRSLPLKENVLKKLISFSPDGRFLAVGTDKFLHIWDAKTYALLTILSFNHIRDLEFTPDGIHLVLSDLLSVQAIHTNDWTSTKILDNSPTSLSVVEALTVSPDGRWLAGGGMESGIISIWSLSELMSQVS